MGRYLTFLSNFGMRQYSVLGTISGLAANALFKMKVGSILSALNGGLIEIIFDFTYI